MSQKKINLILALLVTASLVLTACGNTPAAPAATAEPAATQSPVAATEAPATGPTLADTIIVGAWQEPGTFYDPAVTQAIAVEVELIFRPRFVIRQNYGYAPNPALVEGDLPSLDNGGAVLNDVTVKAGEPYFDTATYVVQPAAADMQLKQLVVTAHLKPELKWDDGQPLTAHDLVFAWKVNCDPTGTQAVDITYCPFESVPGASGILSNFEATDDTTLVATYIPGALDATYFLTPYGLYGILPEHLFSGMTAAEIEVDERATGSENTMPLGFGPYKMDSWVKGDTITFAPNPNWTGATPATPTVIYKFYSDSTSLAAAVIAGEIDATAGQTGLAVDQAPYMKSVASRGIINYSVDLNTASFEMLYFNYYDPTDTTFSTPDPVLSEFCVRKAISLALDRQKMVDTIYYGESSVVQQPQLPQMISYDESLGILTYDPELAKKTLDDCGWAVGADGIREKNGVKASTNYLTTSGNAVRLKASQVLQSSLKDIGIDVKLTYVPSSVAFSKDGLYGRNFNMMQFANSFSVTDPGTWFFGVANCGQIPLPTNAFSGSNYAGWCDQAASDAAADAAYLTLDTAKRKAGWATVLKAYFSEGDPAKFETGGIPVIPLYTRPNYLATSPLLSGVALDPTEYITWNVETWTLEKP
ncbi:MAG: peptide ABC transporter substrate-binding protein [Chloroflexi bacterium]|nr:peptide ABC transporter substrate-binding protein [Chloroflexota bacterium]